MWYISVNGKRFSHCGIDDKDREIKVSFKEFVNSVHGVNVECDFESELATFAATILYTLEVKKCKGINIEVYKRNEKQLIKQIDLSSDAFDVCVLVEGYNKILQFNGIDCVSTCVDEEVVQKLQNRWRILLSDVYGMKSEIVSILEARKKKSIANVENAFDKQIEYIK